MTDQPLSGCYVRIDPTWPFRHLWLNPLGEQINLTYVKFEDGIGDDSTPEYAPETIPGRGEAIQTFMGTSNKEISFAVSFRVQGAGALAIDREVIYPARFLDACKHPVYDDTSGVSLGAPPLWLRLGRLFFGRVILTSAAIQWVEPFEPGTLLPHGADLNLTFQVVRRADPDLGYRLESILSGTWK